MLTRTLVAAFVSAVESNQMGHLCLSLTELIIFDNLLLEFKLHGNTSFFKICVACFSRARSWLSCKCMFTGFYVPCCRQKIPTQIQVIKVLSLRLGTLHFCSGSSWLLTKHHVVISYRLCQSNLTSSCAAGRGFESKTSVDTVFYLGGEMARTVVGGSQNSWGRKKPQHGAGEQNSCEEQILSVGESQKFCRKNLGVKLEELVTLFPPSSPCNDLTSQENLSSLSEKKKQPWQ